jgi:hypothetical protein
MAVASIQHHPKLSLYSAVPPEVGPYTPTTRPDGSSVAREYTQNPVPLTPDRGGCGAPLRLHSLLRGPRGGGRVSSRLRGF